MTTHMSWEETFISYKKEVTASLFLISYCACFMSDDTMVAVETPVRGSIVRS